MKAMVLRKPCERLTLEEVPIPEPKAHQVLIKVHTCGVCRTDLHIVDGELTEPKLPLVPGHQIVGVVEALGDDVKTLQVGQRVGVPWLWKTCGTCSFCKKGQENLCDHAIFTGYQVNGGYAEYTVADESFCLPLPKSFSDIQVAPLLCGGLIGYRSYRMTGEAKRLGFFGFGAAAHILTQLALYEGKQVYAFTRPGDSSTQEFAKKLGAVWTGGSDESPPEDFDAAIIFAPVGPLVPTALKSLKKGGTIVCAGIHMSDIPQFPYKDLWEEKVIRSVANLTRQEAREMLELAPKVPILTNVTVYPLEKTNQALDDLRGGCFDGSAVIKVLT